MNTHRTQDFLPFCTPFIYCLFIEQHVHILSVVTCLHILVNTYYVYKIYVKSNRTGCAGCVIMSGGKWQREIDSWISFRKLPSMTESQFCVSVGCDGFRKSVSGCIDSSALSLFLLRCSFSLVLSLFLLPSVFLSLLPVLAFLPSSSCNKFVGRRTQNKSSLPAVTVRILCLWDLTRICICANYLLLVRDLPSSNMLEAAISVLLFRSTSQTRSCALQMPRYVASITFTVWAPGKRGISRSCCHLTWYLRRI